MLNSHESKSVSSLSMSSDDKLRKMMKHFAEYGVSKYKFPTVQFVVDAT